MLYHFPAKRLSDLFDRNDGAAPQHNIPLIQHHGLTGRYHELFGWNPRGRVLHSPEYIPVREVLATARAAGAVVVFAHPTVYKSMPLLRELVREGMVDGIEIDHPSNSPEDKAECAALCGQYHLIHTGGTDFHGANHKKVYPVGTCTTPDDQIARIEELARKRKK